MTRKELGFLLVGVGVGLIFSDLVVVEFAVWLRHMFILGIKWLPITILLTFQFLFLGIGSLILYRSSGERTKS